MITSISIRNFGLIDSISIDFDPILNVFTGETGAGKSILIDALRFALGEKIGQSQIRDTGSPCVVEAVFDLSDKYLNEYPPIREYITNEDSSLIISRTYLPGGKNTIKLNGFNLTLSQLKEIGNHLVDFHGPNDHQILLAPDMHIKILDRIADIDELMKSYYAGHEVYVELLGKKKKLEEMESTKDRETELLAHQIKELEQVPLDEEQCASIIEEQSRLSNAVALGEEIAKLLELFESPPYGISETVSSAFSSMKKLTALDPGTRRMFDLLESVQINISDLTAELKKYADSLSFDHKDAENVNRQCDVYYEIKRKYGPLLDDARKFYDNAKEKYSLISDIEMSSRDLAGNINSSRQKITKIADKISAARLKTADRLKDTIEDELVELGIKHAKFECRVERTELNRYGSDNVTFYISPNAGEPLKPLSEIVSSGEAARLMLALKKALIQVDPIPVLIFDEIDSQIGGRLGTITGNKLKEIAAHRQVILITHLPQIASFADKHFKVTKKVEKNRTVTQVLDLNKDQRIEELAQMMSGENETDISKKHAKDMLAKAKRD
ncbi:MAG: DNA repair protein RecN [Candidatus Omnitrophica bacterium]|nr:DNA repair protein RecN [Candidatus Omnitrophota bacterium]